MQKSKKSQPAKKQVTKKKPTGAGVKEEQVVSKCFGRCYGWLLIVSSVQAQQQSRMLLEEMHNGRLAAMMGYAVCNITKYDPETHRVHLDMAEGSAGIVLQANPVNDRPVVASHVRELAQKFKTAGAPLASEHVIHVLADPSCIDNVSLPQTVQEAVVQSIAWSATQGKAYLMNGRHRIAAAHEARQALSKENSKCMAVLDKKTLQSEELNKTMKVVESNTAQLQKLEVWAFCLWNKGLHLMVDSAHCLTETLFRCHR